MQPTLASLLNTPYRNNLLQKFLTKTKKDGTIDGQTFWETREFYEPGTFKYSHDGFSMDKISPILKEMNVTLKHTDKLNAFLTFRSSRWVSAEFLIQSQTIDEHIVDATKNKKTILKTHIAWVYYDYTKTLNIIFVKNIDDMKQANGFFDYPGHDKEYLKDKYWLSISKVTL
ncbi:hypothetical protein BH09PAT2_BH09PAT2_09080 [soil metagenome]